MDLGLNAGTATEWISFKPSANAWLMNGEEIDLENKTQLIDPSSLKTGWIKISTLGVETEWDERSKGKITNKAEKPNDDPDFRRGILVLMLPVDKEQNPESNWVQWQTNSVGACQGLQDLFVGISKDDKEAFSKNEDKVLKVKYIGSKINNEGKGVTRIPKFEMMGWVDDPTKDFGKDQEKDMKEASSSDDDVENLF